MTDERGARRLAGVRYHSRLSDEIENRAVLEPAILLDADGERLDATDPDLHEALARFGLTLRG
jgi:hypothetical protein